MSPILLLQRRDFQAFGMASLAEAFILLAAAALVAWSAPLPPPPVPAPIELAQPEPEPPKPEPPKSQPRQSVPAPKPAPVPPPLPQPLPKPLPATPFSEPAPPPPPPPPSSNAAGKPDPGLEYAARVRAAVQAAVAYPPAAAAMNFSGRTRVQFLLQDGVPSHVRIVQGSGLGMVDRAALKSVQDAVYPPPPPPLQGKGLDYQVWVEFNRG